MWLYRHHLGDADALRVPVGADRLPGLDFGGGVEHAPRQFRNREVNVDELS